MFIFADDLSFPLKINITGALMGQNTVIAFRHYPVCLGSHRQLQTLSVFKLKGYIIAGMCTGMHIVGMVAAPGMRALAGIIAIAY
jgi:hypothetical protein